MKVTRRDWLKQVGAWAALGATRLPLRAADPPLVDAVMQLGWIWNVEFAGELMAQERGYYKNGGVNLTLKPGGPEVDEVVLLIARRVLVSVTDPVAVGYASEHGAKLKMLGATFQTAPYCVTSLLDHPILTPKDMVGKKIGAALKQVWALKFVCEVNNVDFNSLTILPISYDPAPLMNHQIDAMLGFATNEPVQMEERGVKSHSMLLCDFGFKELTSTLTVRADALADPAQRKVIKTILDGTIRGWDDAVAQPEVTAKMVTARFGAQYALSESSQLTTLKAQIPFIVTPESKKNGLLTMSDADIAGTIETMTRVGVPIARDAFDTSLIDEIMAERAAGTKPS